MVRKTPSPLRKYLCRVRSWLPCPGSMKRMILSDIQDNALVFLQENPEADYAQLEAHFGTPDRLAANYIQDLDTRKLLRELRLKRRITAIVFSVLITALLVWTAGVVVAVVDNARFNEDYYGGYHEISPPVEP